MSKPPPFTFSRQEYSVIKPAPVISPMSTELEGADSLTLSMLLDLWARIEAKNDQVKIVRATGWFRGVIVAAHAAAFVVWNHEHRQLIWLRHEQVHGRDWPSLISHKLLGHPPDLEIGSEWIFDLHEGHYFGVCQYSPWLLKSISPIAQRFAERYNDNERPAPIPKLKKAKSDDEGTLTHALRPHPEEFSL